MVSNNSKILINRAGNVVNEDIAYIDENMAWVLDAATGLTEKKLTNLESDGRWFVEEWDKYLKNNLLDKSKSIKDIVREGVDLVREKFYKEFSLEFVESIQRPSASVVIIRKVDNEIEFFLLGDCTLLVKEVCGSVVKYKDTALDRLDDKAARIMNEIRNKNNLTFKEAREAINTTLVKHRLLKNKQGGYWTLEFDENSVNHSIVGCYKINNIKSLTLMSDGYSAICDTYNYLSEEKLVDSLSRGKAEEIYNKIREIEEDDKEILKYPRFKKGDDSSVVFYQIGV